MSDSREVTDKVDMLRKFLASNNKVKMPGDMAAVHSSRAVTKSADHEDDITLPMHPKSTAKMPNSIEARQAVYSGKIVPRYSYRFADEDDIHFAVPNSRLVREHNHTDITVDKVHKAGPHPHLGPTVVDKYDLCESWDLVYGAITESIRKADKIKEEVEPDLTEGEYEILFMNRCEEQPKKYLISEEDVIYENLSNSEAGHTHSYTYNQSSSVSFQTTGSHSVNVGLSMGGSGSGASATGNLGYGYSRTTTRGASLDQGKSKTGSVQFKVQPNKAVVVKELAYRVERETNCHLKLRLKKKKVEDKKFFNNAEISYILVSDREGGDSAKIKQCKVTDLWKKGLKDKKWACMEEDWLTCTFISPCCVSTNECSIELIELSISDERKERIMRSYQERFDEDDII